MAAAFVNASSAENSTGSSTTGLSTPASSLTAGNLSVVVLRCGNPRAAGVASVSDTAGNVYTKDYDRANGLGVIWSCANCLGHAANVVSVTYPSHPFTAVTALQFAGVTPVTHLDNIADGYVGSGTTVSCVPGPPCSETIVHEQIVVAASDLGATGVPTFTPSATFTTVYSGVSHRVAYNLNTTRRFDGTVAVSGVYSDSTHGKGIVVGTYITIAGSPCIDVDPPEADEDPCSIKTPLYFAVVQPSNEAGDILQGGQTELRDAPEYYGGYKPPLLVSIGTITRAASDMLTGSFPAQSASVVWADTRRAVRAVFDSLILGSRRNDFTSSPLWIYLTSRVTRAAQQIPRLLFYGFISEDPLSQDLTYTTTANDLVGKDYSLLADEVLLPKQTIRVDEFPHCPTERLGGGVPIIGGPVSNATLALGDASIAGAIKTIDVGDFLCQDGITRRALLICGHDVKSVTPDRKSVV